MSEHPPWTVPLGRWWRVQIRVHALLIVVAVFAFSVAARDSEAGGAAYGALTAGLLFASVLAHVFGHVAAAARVGGNVETIVLGPLGEMGGVEPQQEPHAELIAVLAGPFVNLLIVLATLPALVLIGVSVPGLLAPLTPVGLAEGGWWLVALKTTFWMNWLLLIANLLPAFPLDGARMVRAILWPALDYRGASLLAVRASKLAAVGLCLWARVAGGTAEASMRGLLPLGMLAIFVFFSASSESVRTEQADWNEELFSYDFSQGYTSLERSSEPRPRPQGSLQRWINDRRERRERRREIQEREEEREVDEILSRLHQSGMQGLTARERAILERVSARYRNRQH